MSSLVLDKEAARLETLRQYEILDTSQEEAFDDLVMLAAQICDTPIALINLIDAHRQWFKAKVGIDQAELPRGIGFCSICIEKGDVLIIPDTLASEKFATASVVITEPYVRFYAGIPLKSPEGFIIGTLCVFDTKPKEITQKQVDGLAKLARLTMRQMEVRRNLNQLAVIQIDYKQAREALHQSEHILSKAEEERLRLLECEYVASSRIMNIFESITDGFFALDNNWCFSYLNKQAELLLQHKREELLGQNVWQAFPDAVKSQFYHQYQRAVAERISVEFEEFYQPLNAWFAVHAYPSVDGLSVHFQDITKRKQAEEELNCQQAIMRSMNSVSPLGYYVVNKCSDQVFLLNHRFCQIWGIENLQPEIEHGKLKNKDVIAECLKLVVDIPAFVEAEKLIHNQNNSNVGEDEIKLKDGRVIRRVSTSFRHDGKCRSGRLYIFEDITERKRTEQQMRSGAALLDVTSDAIFLRDLSNKILLWNKSAEKLYGWQTAEVIDSNASDVLSCVKSPQYQEIYNTVLEKGCWQGELIRVTKSGQEIIVDSCWTLVLDEHSKPKSILTVDTDITQKKQLEAQFLRAQRVESIGTLASGIAHDLNNVLSPILMSAQLLSNKSRSPRESQILSIIEKNAKRGADLVKQVLSFARGMEGERTKIQLDNLIYEIQQIVEQTFPKSIEFYTDVKPNLQVISGDNTQLHQVLINLCLNARDAMPEGGKLTLSAENIRIDQNFKSMHIDAKIGQYVLLTLTDTGIGIERKNLDRIFEPFFTTKEFGQGTGLGLSTVMGIIKGHGGFVHVSSTVGKGTQFKVYLPAVNRDITLNSLYAEVPRGNGELILVVDDEPSITEITKASLESYNYEVITASDGIEAVAIFAQHKNRIKAAIIDIMMPNMDGSTTISTLLRMNPLIPIVAVSGLATSDSININKDNHSQVFTFLPKPYTAQELFSAVYKVLTLVQ